MSKEFGTPRYLSLVVPLKKVGDEGVHKELGDRMKRATTTASSIEAEQDSGSGPRCQDTILGDVNAQTRFEIASKQSNDPPLSRGYTLGSGEDSMKLLELMEFCTQLSYKNRKSVLFLLLVYFTAAKLMLGSVNAVRHMLMLPVQVPAAEGFAETHNVVAFLEKPVESDGFAEIIDFLKASSVHYALTVNPIIYTSCIEQFWTTAKVQTVNGVRQLQALVDKKRVIITESSIRRDLYLDEQKDFSWRITPLFATMIVQASEEVGEDSGQPTDSTQVPILDQPSTSFKPKKKQPSKKTQRQEVEVLDLEKEKDAQAKEIAALKKRIQRRVESSEDQESFVAPEDTSKHGRNIADIDADVEMHVEARIDEKDEQSTKLNDSTAGEAIKAAKPKVVTTAATTTTTTRPKAKGVLVQEPSEFRVIQEAQPSISKDKGKGIMIEPEVPLKRKDQIAFDEQIARDIQAKLDAEIIEEQKLARKQ
ncbi:hypothetical protein Tco_0298750 [Tanacetum coccineum]